MQSEQYMTAGETREVSLNMRLEEIGWALFLIMIGALWLLPAGRLPDHSWLVGAGLIMLGINFARYIAGIRMSGFTMFLGVVALVAGIGGIYSIELPIFPALFLVLGVGLLLRAFFKK